MKQEMENGNVEGRCKGNGRVVGRRIVKQFSRNSGEEKMTSKPEAVVMEERYVLEMVGR